MNFYKEVLKLRIREIMVVFRLRVIFVDHYNKHISSLFIGLITLMSAQEQILGSLNQVLVQAVTSETHCTQLHSVLIWALVFSTFCLFLISRIVQGKMPCSSILFKTRSCSIIDIITPMFKSLLNVLITPCIYIHT